MLEFLSVQMKHKDDDCLKKMSKFSYIIHDIEVACPFKGPEEGRSNIQCIHAHFKILDNFFLIFIDRKIGFDDKNHFFRMIMYLVTVQKLVFRKKDVKIYDMANKNSLDLKFSWKKLC